MATITVLGLALAAALFGLWKLLTPWKVRARTRIDRVANGFRVVDIGICAEKAALAGTPRADARAYEVAFYFTIKRRSGAGM